MNKNFCFVHIEKAGGSSIHNWLKYYLPNYLSLHPFYRWTNEDISKFSLRELKILKKFHPFLVGFGSHRTRHNLNYSSVFNCKLKYFTFLREPISRYVSHFEHQRNVMKNNYTIEEFLNEKRFNNFMTNRIINENDYRKSIVELEKFDFVGLFEDFNRSILMLMDNLDIAHLKPLYEKRNVSSYNKIDVKSFDDATIELIYKNNEEDIKLYNYFVNNIYPKQISNYSSNLENDLKYMKKEIKYFKYNKSRILLLKLSKVYNHYFSERIAHFLK